MDVAFATVDGIDEAAKILSFDHQVGNQATFKHGIYNGLAISGRPNQMVIQFPERHGLSLASIGN
jgi:hypothetical protein